MNIVLWIVQVLLALVYAYAGGFKLVAAAAEMQGNMPVALPIWFVRFIGVCEVAAALGMILPGLFRVLTFLTPLAAAGLVIIMAGATVITAYAMSAALAAIPLVMGILAAFVAYGRWRLAPLRKR